MIRPLTESDLPEYAALRREALLDAPLAFAASPDDDFAANVDALRESMRKAPDWVIFGAFEERLAGSVGLIRDKHLKAAHKMHLWGMYVTPSHRGRGLGRQLLDAAIEHARAVEGIDWIFLGVTTAAPAARRLYERAGFEIWGTEPDALREGGTSVVEHRLAIRL
jgi:ribosomal protein S18 acetylase RimI-like enzyme